jgi:hypothetical protein
MKFSSILIPHTINGLIDIFFVVIQPKRTTVITIDF